MLGIEDARRRGGLVKEERPLLAALAAQQVHAVADDCGDTSTPVDGVEEAVELPTTSYCGLGRLWPRRSG